MAEPKLTEAGLRSILDDAGAGADWRNDNIVNGFRERGLIAEEPVDPLLLEAREITAQIVGALGASWFGSEFRKGRCDDHRYMQIALAALRRGIEIGEANRKELTREGVRDALVSVWPNWAFVSGEGGLTRLHAALQEQLK
jgi:hypothetical protein